MRGNIWLFCGALSVATIGGPEQASGQDIQVEASVNATRVGLDDTLELTVSIQGDAMGRAGSPKLPKLEGLRVGGQSQSTNIQWINGQMTATRSIIYRLLPHSEGKVVIGAISVEYGGKEYLTDPIEIEVVSGSVVPRAGRRSPGAGVDPMDPFDRLSPFRRREQRPTQPGEVFVTASLSKSKAYVGEQVLLSYKLFTQTPIIGLQVDEQPPLTGFWVEEVEMPQKADWKETTLDGKPFYTVEIKKNVLFPTKPGSITIEPAIFSMGVRASSGDPFDSFFAPISQEIRRSTKPLTLEVSPLPTSGKPADFSGAVGQFNLKAELDNRETIAGEPLTLSVILEGEGNLKTVEPPELPALPGLRAYDPKTEEELSTRNSRFGGQKRWEYVLVADSAGRHQIGSMGFSYFDPATQKYVKLQTEPLTLDVAAGAAVAGALGASSRGAVQLLRRDIRYLKPAPERFGTSASPFYGSGLFYATLALPVLWNLGLVAYQWKRQSEAAQAGLFRARRAQKTAQGRLKHARQKARSASRDFFEETAEALYRYVADKLGVSSSGLTTQSIDTMLAERGVPAASRSAFLKTIESCEFARFTPGERTREEMESLLERAEKIIVSLEKHFA